MGDQIMNRILNTFNSSFMNYQNSLLVELYPFKNGINSKRNTADESSHLYMNKYFENVQIALFCLRADSKNRH